MVVDDILIRALDLCYAPPLRGACSCVMVIVLQMYCRFCCRWPDNPACSRLQ